MRTTKDIIVDEAGAYVESFYERHISPDFVYHNFDHVQEVLRAAEDLAGSYELADKELEILRLAALFHDTGYSRGPDNHEQLSCKHAREFLKKYQYPEEDVQSVLNCILATRMDRQPQNLLEEILCDADMSHLGSKTYWDRCGKVRQELNLTQHVLMSEKEWIDFELTFMATHEYYTDAAKERYEERKQKHIKQLKKHRQRLYPNDPPPLPVEVLVESANGEEGKEKKKGKGKKKKNKKLKENLGRGVETMYRTTYRTHINLSSIADNKANIMLSINAIIISIVVSNLATKLDSNTFLIIPTSMFLVVCMGSLVFAILSTRPKITEGRFMREDIEKKTANLLFFGNFYRMELEDFHWGMMEMIKDSDFLYSSMTRDLYYLGVVLAKKYRYLRICYSIFMYGMILALLSYGLAYLLFLSTNQ